MMRFIQNLSALRLVFFHIFLYLLRSLFYIDVLIFIELLGKAIKFYGNLVNYDTCNNKI